MAKSLSLIGSVISRGGAMPQFKHRLDTPEGRHERAVFTIREADGRYPMASVTEFLKQKGMTDNEIMAAFDEASNGAVVDSALGK